jgi:acyl carrier protein
MLEINRELRSYIIDNFLFGQNGDGLSDSDSFLEKGIIDSTGVLELVGFLEQQYKIRIEDEDLVPENLDSVERLVRFLAKKGVIKE